MVNLSHGLNLVPFIGHKISPPNADGCGRSGGYGLDGTHRLAGGQKDTSWSLPVNEEDVDGALVPDQVANVDQLQEKVQGDIKLLASTCIQIYMYIILYRHYMYTIHCISHS